LHSCPTRRSSDLDGDEAEEQDRQAEDAGEHRPLDRDLAQFHRWFPFVPAGVALPAGAAGLPPAAGAPGVAGPAPAPGAPVPGAPAAIEGTGITLAPSNSFW